MTPKSGKIRSVPMVPDVARALARLGQREMFTVDEDPVFANAVGRHLDASALRRRYMITQQRARLWPLPFHPLRHYFGSTAVNKAASPVQVQSWMGHSHIQTTARCTRRAKRATPPSSRRRSRPGGHGRAVRPGSNLSFGPPGPAAPLNRDSCRWAYLVVQCMTPLTLVQLVDELLPPWV